MWKRNVIYPFAASGFVLAGAMCLTWFSRTRSSPGPQSPLFGLIESDITSLYAWLGLISLLFACSFLKLGRMLMFTSDPPEDTNIPKLIDEQAERIKQLEAQVAWLNARLGPPST